MASEADLRLGGELAGYRLERVLGRGGMGVVYLAEDVRLARKVALKLLAAELAEDERFRERFLRESRLAASLDHPNIIPIYEAGELDGRLYIAMRYVEGSDLEQLLGREGRLAPGRALALVTQLAGALDAAHARGLVHRDVKPGNVLVAADDHVYLSDFGLTKQATSISGLTATGQLVGTLDYVAPEQIRGDAIDGRTDVYSLGCLLYECLVGEPPFKRDSDVAVLWAHVHEPPLPASAKQPELPRALDTVLEQALAKRPDERTATCSEFAAAARAAFPDAAAPAVSLPGRRIAAALGAVAILLVGVVAAVALMLVTGRESEPALPPGTPHLGVINPETNELEKRIAIGPAPVAIAVGAGSVWVGNAKGHLIAKIDPASGRTVESFTAAGGPSSIVVAGGYVWTSDIHEPWGVHRIKVDELRELHRVANLPKTWRSTLLVYGFGSVWVANGTSELLRIRSGGSTLALDVTPRRCLVTGIAVGVSAVWIACGDGRIARVNPASNRRTATLRIDSILSGLAAGAGAVWAADLRESVVWRIDPREARLVRTISVGRAPIGIAVGEGAVWVLNRDDRTVSRIDPATNRVTATVKLEKEPSALSVGEGKVWVTFAEGTLAVD